MAKENSNTATNETPAPNPMASMFGDMSMLRDIIMGPKIIEYNDRFEAVHTLIEKNDKAVQALIDKNEAATNARFEALERDMNAKFDRLEQLLNQNVEHLTKLIQETSKSDKATLADLLTGVSQKLKG